MYNGKFVSFLFSPLIRRSSAAAKIAYVGAFTALSVVSNMFFEFKFYDIQYSLTIFFSAIIGVFLGPLLGFCACFAGDFIGYLVNSQGQLFMPWVGLSTATFAFLSGAILRFKEDESKLSKWLKLLIYTVVSFLICTVGINSTGFYLFNKTKGFSPAVINYVAETFGGEVSFIGYVFYRLFFKLQILNSVFNYALLFVAFPLILNAKGLKQYL